MVMKNQLFHISLPLPLGWERREIIGTQFLNIFKLGILFLCMCTYSGVETISLQRRVGPRSDRGEIKCPHLPEYSANLYLQKGKLRRQLPVPGLYATGLIEQSKFREAQTLNDFFPNHCKMF